MIFLPKSASSVSRSQAYLPKRKQAYTQPYSFGGKIKLIICQIRHELSVTIHEISTSGKKTLDGGPNIKERSQFLEHRYLEPLLRDNIFNIQFNDRVANFSF